MSRTLSAGLITHVAGDAHTRCTMLRLDLVDGSILAVTDHDEPITFNLGDGATTYSPSTGILPSDLSLSTGFDPDDVEVTGPITEDGLTTLAAVIGGRFDEAAARLFQIDWSTLASGPVRLLRGRVARSDVEGSRFKLTVHSEVSKYSQSVGRSITGYCDAEFGDARCGFTPFELAATVASVTDERAFTVTFAGTYANDFFNRGTVSFGSGALVGIRPVEIFDWFSGGAIALWIPLPEAPQVGDTLTIRQGCSKVRSSEDPAQPTCMSYDNVINFRGFPDVPGSDKALRYPNPGSSG